MSTPVDPVRKTCPMRTEGPFHAGNPTAAAILVRAAGEDWGVPVRAAATWTRAASYAVRGGRARWSLEYDPRMRLLSFEVWEDERCVYGSDEVVG